jgi:hypothetical protein
MILSDLNDLGSGSRQPFFPSRKSAIFAVDFNHRSNPSTLGARGNCSFSER